jgi:hypothetical protein
LVSTYCPFPYLLAPILIPRHIDSTIILVGGIIWLLVSSIFMLSFWFWWLELTFCPVPHGSVFTTFLCSILGQFFFTEASLHWADTWFRPQSMTYETPIKFMELSSSFITLCFWTALVSLNGYFPLAK